MNYTMKLSVFEWVEEQNLILNRQIWYFEPNLLKMCISCSKRACERHHWIQHIGVSLGPRFHLKQDNYDFLDHLWLKNLFPIQNKANEHRHQIQLIWISLGSDFDLKQIHLIVCITFTKKNVFPVQSRTNKHHHQMQHIWISLGIKFHLKITILVFLTKVSQKVYFSSKAGKLNIPLELTYLNYSRH